MVAAPIPGGHGTLVTPVPVTVVSQGSQVAHILTASPQLGGKVCSNKRKKFFKSVIFLYFLIIIFFYVIGNRFNTTKPETREFYAHDESVYR